MYCLVALVPDWVHQFISKTRLYLNPGAPKTAFWIWIFLMQIQPTIFYCPSSLATQRRTDTVQWMSVWGLSQKELGSSLTSATKPIRQLQVNHCYLIPSLHPFCKMGTTKLTHTPSLLHCSQGSPRQTKAIQVIFPLILLQKKSYAVADTTGCVLELQK